MRRHHIPRGMMAAVTDFAGLAAADAHLGRPLPLPATALPLTRWTALRAAGPAGVEIEWNLDDTRAGAPGPAALYVGLEPAPEREWPSPDPGSATWPSAPCAGAGARPSSSRPNRRCVSAVELSWEAHGLSLRLTAQGPWPAVRLLEIAASVRPPRPSE